MRAAVITSKGLGDGLIMSIAALHLIKAGYSTDLFNPQLEEMQSWFSWRVKRLKEDLSFADLAGYDWVLCQYSNTALVQRLIECRHLFKRFSLVYPAYNSKRHGRLEKDDFVCLPEVPLADSLKIMGGRIFRLENAGKDLELNIPGHLRFQKHGKRVLIHPSSTCPTRSWSCKKYLKFAGRLKKEGYEAAFIMSLKERGAWEGIQKFGFLLPRLCNLHDLAGYIYESRILIGNDSGPAHLASLLGLKTMIITNDPKRLALWQPGWRKAELVFPPKWVPNFKFLRLKINHWQKFTGLKRIVRSFKKLQISI